jgi:fimbrial isopeptide formation D2 family protein/LPXTG-motif cell wall-anchored protein
LLGLWNAHGSRKPFEPDPAKINIFIWGNLKGDLSMKQIKRIMAFALALVLTLAMSITVFAEDKKPDLNDTAKITVENVESGATVTAYKYVQADYTGNGLSGYSIVKDEDGKDIVTIANIYEDPSVDEIIGLTAHTGELQSVELDDNKDNTYSKEVAAGSYLILVTGTKSNIYNPMVVSVSYDTAKTGSSNTLVDNSISAKDTITLQDSTVYAKSSTPTVAKSIKSVTNGNTDEVESGSKYDAAVDDIVTFEITTTIPSYSKAYDNNLTFELTDTMADGFEYVKTDSVTVAGTKDDKLTLTQDTKNEQILTIDLSGVAKTHYNQTTEVVITYQAKLTDDAAVSDAGVVSANTNTVELKYSTSPNGDTKTTDDTTYSYTYSISSTEEEATGLLTKIDANGNALPGAEFTLENTEHSYTVTSGADGNIAFSGIDSGTYTLTETAAPSGYSLTNVTYTVEITPNYDEKTETVTAVTIKITDDKTGKEVTNTKVEIQNTKLSSLPETGGIGTTIFTIAGCLIMIAAAGMYFASRRKSAK